MNVWAILNTATKKVVAEVTHFQLAASVEDSLIAEWRSSFVGPFPQTICIPFTCCRLDAMTRFYPEYA